MANAQFTPKPKLIPKATLGTLALLATVCLPIGAANATMVNIFDHAPQGGYAAIVGSSIFGPGASFTATLITASTYNWSYSDGTNSGSGTLTIGSGNAFNLPGGFDVTGITGTFDSETITGLDALFSTPDNVFYPSGCVSTGSNGVSLLGAA